MISRREFIVTAAAVTFVAPRAAKAQQAARIPSVGILRHGTSDDKAWSIDTLQQGLRDLGYGEGQTIALEYRFSEQVARGQIALRRIDGWRKISAELCQHTAVAA